MDKFSTLKEFEEFIWSHDIPSDQIYKAVDQLMALTFPEENLSEPEKTSNDEEGMAVTLQHKNPSSTQTGAGGPVDEIKKPLHRCKVCGKGFTQNNNMRRHERTHKGKKEHHCPQCQKIFTRKSDLKKHINLHKRRGMEKEFRCGFCDKIFQNKAPFNTHQKEHHPETKKRKLPSDDSGPSRKKSKPVANEKAPPRHFTWVEDPVDLSALPQDHQTDILEYIANWSRIRTRFSRNNRLANWYNFRLSSLHPDNFITYLKDVFHDQTTVFKLNVSFGFILKNTETDQLVYYYASRNNNNIFESPFLVANENDLTPIINALQDLDVKEWTRQQRPTSKFVVDKVTNISFFITKVRGHVIGRGKRLPHYVVENRGIVPLDCDKQTGQPYRDNLCFFRALAVHNGGHAKNLERDTKFYYERYRQNYPSDEFCGVTLEELPNLETLFELNINVYSLEKTTDHSDVDDEQTEERPDITAQLVVRSHRKFTSTMYLNIYENHFSYIKDMKHYSKSYCCSRCGKYWKEGFRLNRHERTCEGQVKHIFPGGAYKSPQTLFDELEDIGVEVPDHLRYFPYRATFDLECFFSDPGNIVHNTDKLTWESKHELLSASVCSNVPGYDKPLCMVTDGNSDSLVKRLIDYMGEISEASYRCMLERYEQILENLDRIDEEMASENQQQTPQEDESDGDSKNKVIERIKKRLDDYLIELPVLGFNSGRYDLNAIKKYIFPYLVKNNPLQFTVKKNNNFMCLKTENLKFLDITNYLAPGFSYAQFLKAYECPQTKGFFPYEWVTSLDKLNHPSLPPHQAFYSSLTNKNISDQEYRYCRQVWADNNMQTFKDFLIFYNNLDVQPFLQAIDKMCAFWKERQIDMFKDGLSVPGLTMKYLFSTLPPHIYFTLYNEKDSDLFYLMRQNNVGGPSIVFQRYSEKNKTPIREVEMAQSGQTPKPCKNVVGYDANALYLWCLMQPMPTGCYTRRRASQDFKPEFSLKMAVEWLEWESHHRDIPIRHQMNNKEKRLGQRCLPVDGYHGPSRTVFQFQGCYWHGHRCHLTEGKARNEKNGKTMEELLNETVKNKEYLEGLGYTVVEKWECEWRQEKKQNPAIRQFIDAHLRRPLDKTWRMTEKQVLQAVLDEKLFGCVECDIEVPDHLKDHFSEMCPIFKNTQISREDIGDYMRQFAEERNIMNQPRGSLIGSMHGKSILLATPLLKWYLEHGLQVTKIYQVVEYTPDTCFQPFGDAVSDARRAGDVDQSKAIIAETMKLVGNSSYGKTITNKEKHRDIKFCSEDEAPLLVNTMYFRGLEQIDDDTYEVQSCKKKIKFDLPIQIGFFVYQYAKLRMLQFYYDCLDKYLDRSDYHYCEMDTDSAYIALAGESIEELVKPELKEEFLRDKGNWFPRTDTDEHKAYDKRTPGLFKIEWEGDGIISLCSKTYYCFGRKDKFSCKGVSKKNNCIDKDKYLNVLLTKESSAGINKGFRVVNNEMYTYTQIRDGFSYFYPKRKVLDDGISTVPLDI